MQPIRVFYCLCYMKKTLFVLFLLCSTFFNTAKACSPILVPTLVSQAVVGSNLQLMWSSNTTYNCTYWIDVEIYCNTGTPTGLGPFYVSPSINKTSTPFPYPMQTISLTNLCPGQVYFFRAREAYSAFLFSPWTATFNFTTPGLPIVPTINVTGNPTIICAPQTAQLNCVVGNTCGTATPLYSWAPAAGLSNTGIANPTAGPTVQTQYTCFVSGGTLLSCWQIQDTITISGGVVIANAGLPTAICIGGNTTLNASGGSTYAWAPAGTLSNPNIANPIATPTVTTTYTVTVSVLSCTSTATVTVTVNPLPVVSFTAPDTMGCAPIVVAFANSTPNSTICSWSFGYGNDTISCTNPVIHTYLMPGVYTVTLYVTDANGCVNSSTHTNMVVVYGYPIACFSAGNQPTTILEPTIPFTDCSVGASTYFWDFGDAGNSTSTVQNPFFTYTDTGHFQVMHVVCNSTQCCDTAYMDTYIGPYFGIYVPNAFTPNNDTHNDYFRPEGSGLDLTTYHLWIYDRWGELIFETKDWNTMWDGKVKGNKVQEYVYVWKLEVSDYMFYMHKLTGHVSVIR